MFINSLMRSCWSDTIWLQLRNVNDWYTMRRLFTYKLTQTIWKQQILWMKVKQNHAENTPTSKPKHSQIHINLYLYLEILRNNSSLFFCVFVFRGRSESLMPLFLQERLKRTSYIKCFCQRSRRSAFSSFVFSSSSSSFFAIEKWKDGGGQKIPMAHEKSEGKGRSVKKRGGKGQKEQR